MMSQYVPGTPNLGTIAPFVNNQNAQSPAAVVPQVRNMPTCSFGEQDPRSRSPFLSGNFQMPVTPMRNRIDRPIVSRDSQGSQNTPGRSIFTSAQSKCSDDQIVPCASPLTGFTAPIASPALPTAAYSAARVALLPVDASQSQTSCRPSNGADSGKASPRNLHRPQRGATGEQATGEVIPPNIRNSKQRVPVAKIDLFSGDDIFA